MATRKKAWKLQDFVAHSADVRCLGLGHRSGRVMVTGGDDNKVNLWSVDKPHCIMSLTGHTSSVESVRFAPDEEMVVAGSLSGTLKIWDLEQAKILRALASHKAAVRSLDFHPYGNYVASGSVDCSVKLWDIRRKGIIHTYKSHTMSVNCLRFTPDGQWIASASDDGTVKIWDLNAGKLLSELNLHKGPVNTVEFHPSDLLLASGGGDKTVKFWDLESFQCISSSDQDKQPVKSIHFHPEGSCLFSACGDSLKVYGWEPFICHDVIPIQWSEVADIAIVNSQAIAASFSKMNVSTFAVDLTKVAPIGVVSKSEHVRETLQSSSGRRSFILDPQTSSSRQPSEPKRSDTPPDKNESIDDENSASRADIQHPDDYKKFFKENAKNSHTKDRVEPFQPPPEDDNPEPTKASYFQPVPIRNEVSPPFAKPPVQKVDKGHVQAEDFLPQQKAQSESLEKELTNLQSGHSTMISVMEQRNRNLQVFLTMWRTGSTKTAIDSAISMKDPAVMADLLNIINTKSSVWDLDLCKQLLPQLKELMGSKYESHFVTASNSVKMILRAFGDVIKANMEEPPTTFVDITRDERHKKCLACYTVLSSIKAMIRSTQSTATAKQANIFKEIMLLMARLD